MRKPSLESVWCDDSSTSTTLFLNWSACLLWTNPCTVSIPVHQLMSGTDEIFVNFQLLYFPGKMVKSLYIVIPIVICCLERFWSTEIGFCCPCHHLCCVLYDQWFKIITQNTHITNAILLLINNSNCNHMLPLITYITIITSIPMGKCRIIICILMGSLGIVWNLYGMPFITKWLKVILHEVDKMA